MCNASDASDQLCVFYEFLDTIIERPFWLQVMFTTLMCAIFVVGATGNLLTCVVIYCDRSLHTSTNYYLFNLALSDLIVSFGILLELDLLINQNIEYDVYGEVICRIELFLVIALWNNGILIMTALAIERYIAVWHPLLVDRKPVWRRVMKIIALIWSLAILEALPEIWTVHYVRVGPSGVCYIVPTTFARFLNGILGLVTFVIPLTIMTFMYTMVAVKVNITQMSNSKDKIFNQRNNTSKVNGLVTLTLSFLVCWMPFFLMRVIIVVADWKWTRNFLKNWDTMLILCSCNSWFSIILNPLLFSVMSTKFRKAFKNLWNTKVRRVNSTTARTRSVVI